MLKFDRSIGFTVEVRVEASSRMHASDLSKNQQLTSVFFYFAWLLSFRSNRRASTRLDRSTSLIPSLPPTLALSRTICQRRGLFSLEIVLDGTTLALARCFSIQEVTSLCGSTLQRETQGTTLRTQALEGSRTSDPASESCVICTFYVTTS